MYSFSIGYIIPLSGGGGGGVGLLFLF